MGGASTSTSLIPQLVQVVIPPQHVLTLASYTVKRNNDSQNIRIKPLNVSYSFKIDLFRSSSSATDFETTTLSNNSNSNSTK